MADSLDSDNVLPRVSPLPPSNANERMLKAIWKDHDVSLMLDQVDKHKAEL